MTVYITEWTKTYLAARDGDGGGEMGALLGIMIITITHRTVDCTGKDRSSTGLSHLILTRLAYVSMSALRLSVRSRCLSQR